MVPVLMTGEMKEWSAEVPIEEVHNFEWQLFKNSTDTNIQLLVRVMELVDETYLSLQNLNDIQVEEEEEE